jgi:hypothetical protein
LVANPGGLPPNQPKLFILRTLQRHPGSWTARNLRREAQGRYAEGKPLLSA